MRISGNVEDVTDISYDIYRKGKFSIKFKVKVYSENQMDPTSKYYYYNEFVNQSAYIMNISINPYLQITLGDSGRGVLFLNEVLKNRYIRKLSKIASCLEAYDSEDIDILVVNQNGTQISNKYDISASFKLGAYNVSANIIFDDTYSRVMVLMEYNKSPILMTMTEFMRIYIQLAQLSYMNMGMQLVNFLGRPDTIGSHKIDYRYDMYTPVDESPDEVSSSTGAKSIDQSNGLESIAENRYAINNNTTNKVNW